MCHRVTCHTCGKPTWAGCGNHVEAALAGVPEANRCQGHQSEPKQASSIFGSLFGRG